MYIAHLSNATEADIVEKALINKYKPILNVNDNYEELEKIAKQYQEGKKVKYDTNKIKNISVYNIGENSMVNFIVIDSKTTYGFYYTEKKEPIPYEDTELIQTGKDEWIWSKIDESEGKIKQIRDNWFYYKKTSKK